MSCHFTSLEHDALLHLSGPDALAFLQGQLSCDTRKLNRDTALPGLFCTAQGRVICDFLLVELAPGHLALRMRRDIRAASAELFSRYIIFSKAELDAERDDWQVLACWGPAALEQLGEVFGVAPSSRYGACQGEGFAIVQMDEAGQQFECLLAPAAKEKLLTHLDKDATPAPEIAWQGLQLASGVARIEAATTGEFIPQMLNYDLTGHISFNKGCYTGQEVVARMHYRGKSKRRLYLASLDSAALAEQAEPPAPGDALYSPTGKQATGKVVNCVAQGDGTIALLASATADGVEAGLHLSQAQGPALQIGSLPYSLPD